VMSFPDASVDNEYYASSIPPRRRRPLKAEKNRGHFHAPGLLIHR